jgi:hypothetical protein
VTFALLLFWATVDLIILGVKAELTKSDWASWVQAVGSVLAICVALFLAGAQQRKARQDALVVATVAAIQLHHTVSSALVATNTALEKLDRASVSGFQLQDISFISNLIAHIEWCEHEDMSLIIPLPSDCALHVAKAQILIVQARTVISDLMRDTGALLAQVARERALFKARGLLALSASNYLAAATVLDEIGRSR